MRMRALLPSQRRFRSRARSPMMMRLSRLGRRLRGAWLLGVGGPDGVVGEEDVEGEGVEGVYDGPCKKGLRVCWRREDYVVTSMI